MYLIENFNILFYFLSILNFKIRAKTVNSTILLSIYKNNCSFMIHFLTFKRNRIVTTPYNIRSYVVSCINFSMNPLSKLISEEVWKIIFLINFINIIFFFKNLSQKFTVFQKTFKDYYESKNLKFNDLSQPLIEIDM